MEKFISQAYNHEVQQCYINASVAYKAADGALSTIIFRHIKEQCQRELKKRKLNLPNT